MAFVGRIVGGIVLVAMVIGIGLWAERLTDDEFALPDEFGGLVANDSDEVRTFAAAHRAAISEAYDGADALAAVYGPNTKIGMLVTAVRAESGPLVPQVFSQSEDWVEEDDVTCLVTPSRKGPASTQCQRGDGDLTIRVVVRGRPDLSPLVDAINEFWEELS